MTGKHQMKGTRVGRECRNDLDTPTSSSLDYPLYSVPKQELMSLGFQTHLLGQVGDD